MAELTLRGFLLACCSAATLFVGTGVLQAQDDGSLDGGLDGVLAAPGAGGVSSQSASAQPRVAPLTSSFVLNGFTLDYAGTGFHSLGVQTGDQRNGTVALEGTYALQRSLTEGLDGTLFLRRQSGWYLQFRTTDDQRTITTTREEAGALAGSRALLTVTGGCLSPDAVPGSLCTFTPGLEVDPATIDPDTLVPTGFIITSEFEQAISRETHLALQAPGFQRGVEGGDEVVGIALDLVNNGFTIDPGRAGLNGIDRQQEVVQRGLLTLSQVEQNLYSTDAGAALDRTIRSFVLLDDDEWSREALAVQALAWLLPSFDARLDGGTGDANLRISNNLFLAANNLRLPQGGVGAYQSGSAWVTHSATPPQRASETPVAWAGAVWLGFSPVRDIERTSRLSYIPAGDRETVESEFAQGGLGGTWGELLGSITIVDEIDQQITEIDFSELDDLFVQTGTELTRQNAIRRIVDQEVSTYRYVPHLSFTGNRTSGTSVLRYFAGVLLPDDTPNAYVGADFALHDEAGWSSYLRAEFYSNPDQDHYSRFETRLSRTFAMGAAGRMTLGFSGYAELDRPEADGSAPRLGEGSTGIDLVSGYQSERFDLTFRQRFTDLDQDSGSTSSTFGLVYRLNPLVTLSAEHTPFSDEDSYVLARAGLSVALDDAPDAPALRLQWMQAAYDYGTDAAGRDLETTETTFLAAFQVRF